MTLKLMRCRLVIALCAGASWFSNAYRPTMGNTLLAFLLLLVVGGQGLLGLFSVAAHVRGREWKALVATALCFAAVPIGALLGGAWADYDFLHRRMSIYMRVIDNAVRTATDDQLAAGLVLHEQVNDLGVANHIIIYRSPGGAIRAEVSWGGGGPPPWVVGYYYASTDPLGESLREHGWSWWRKVAPCWFEYNRD